MDLQTIENFYLDVVSVVRQRLRCQKQLDTSWYILGREVQAESRRKTPENARNLEAGIQWRILWLDFPPPVTVRNFWTPAVEYDHRIPASKFPSISGEFWSKTASFLRIRSPEISWNTASEIIDLEWALVMDMIHELGI